MPTYLSKSVTNENVIGSLGSPVTLMPWWWHCTVTRVTGMQVDKTCCYDIHVYPTMEFYNMYNTSTPLVITFSIVGVFIVTVFMFLFYDRLVERRQKIVLAKATQSTAIVSSFFPKNVWHQLMEAEAANVKGLEMANKSRLKGFLAGDDKENESSAAPIADLFPNCTVSISCGLIMLTCCECNAKLSLSILPIPNLGLLCRYCRIYCLEQYSRALTGLHLVADSLPVIWCPGQAPPCIQGRNYWWFLHGMNNTLCTVLTPFVPADQQLTRPYPSCYCCCGCLGCHWSSRATRKSCHQHGSL